MPTDSAPRRRYARRVCGPGQTGCSAVVDNAEWSILGPVLCGWLASHPHPDPERSYLEPLCETHYEQEVERHAHA